MNATHTSIILVLASNKKESIASCVEVVTCDGS